MSESEIKEACDNCQEMFPKSKILSHSSYCSRNRKKCDRCDIFIDINSG